MPVHFPTIRFFLILVFASGVVFSALSPPAIAQIEKSDGKGTSENYASIEKIDDEMASFMEAIGATAATVAISNQGEIVYSRGYGFADRRGLVKATPKTTMRLASCTKPFTAAAIRILIRRGDISADTKVFDYLGIPAFKELADERIKQITVAHLLDHQGGWDRESTFDPLYQIADIRKSLGVSKLEKRHIVRYMWDRPLQNAPGAEEHYSNFGYVLLGLVIEKATGESYIESIRELIADPAGIGDLSISSLVQRNRKSREVHYPNDNDLNLHLRDSASGLAATSETLCKFMDAYWIDGHERGPDRNQFFFQFGSHPFTTTTVMEQRLDGINYAIMLNSRRNDSCDEDNDVIRNNFNLVLDSVRSGLINR